LHDAGLTGIEAMTYKGAEDLHVEVNMISRCPPTPVVQGEVSILYNGTINERGRIIERKFLDDGYVVSWFTLTEISASNHNVVSLLDLDEAPFFDNISEKSFLAFRKFISDATPQTILWITRDIHMQPENPRWSLILGIARTLRLELSLPFATVGLTAWDSDSLTSLIKIYQTIQSSLPSGSDLDYEYVVRGGSIYTSRYHPTPLATQSISKDKATEVSKRLTIGTYGLLDSIHWVQDDTNPPGPGEVEIDIKYVGLNFRVCILYLGSRLDTILMMS
jgi:hypothetical protein